MLTDGATCELHSAEQLALTIGHLHTVDWLSVVSWCVKKIAYLCGGMLAFGRTR